jgi:glycosyltransferase involved in cell wall biosynthesis
MNRFVIFTSLPRVGGHSTLTLGLCELMRWHFDEVEVLCKTMPEWGFSPKTAEALAAMGCRVTVISDENGRLLYGKLMAALWRAWRQPPACFLSLAMRHFSVVLAFLMRGRNRIYYHITHDLNAKTVSRLECYARFFSAILFISPATIKRFPRNQLPACRIDWCPQSSEIAGIGARVAFRERSETGLVRFGVIGRLSEPKGAGEILKFIDTCAVPCEVHIAGNGDYAEQFQGKATAPENMTRAVKAHFYGAYDPTERVQFLAQFFSQVDLVVVATIDEWESLTMAILEGLQYGIPAIATRTGGLRSFEMPELGPAPSEVVRLVEISELQDVLSQIAQNGLPKSEIAVKCRAYYEEFFANSAIIDRWKRVLGTSGRRVCGS